MRIILTVYIKIRIILTVRIDDGSCDHLPAYTVIHGFLADQAVRLFLGNMLLLHQKDFGLADKP